MKTILGKWGLSEESAILEGEPEEVAKRVRDAHDAKLRPARLDAARANPRWHEVAEADLVRRGHYLVHAPSDEVFLPARGAIFERDSTVPINDTKELWFHATGADADELVFLEGQPRRWSDMVARQTAKELRRSAERPTPEWTKP